MPVDQLQPGQIRQISQPVLNPNDGYYYNEVRIIQADGSGGFVVVSDEFNRCPIQFSDYPLPTPWVDNIETWQQAQLGQISIDLGSGNLGGAIADEVNYWVGMNDIWTAMREGGDPFAGTIYDKSYSQWPDSDSPWSHPPQPKGAPASPATPGNFPNPSPMNERPAYLPPSIFLMSRHLV
jgi:hypothetical protein